MPDARLETQTEGTYRHEVLAVVLRVHQNDLEVLLWQRRSEPYAGAWALPGGSVAPDERLGASLARQLAYKVDLREIAHLEQLETRGDPQRDTRRRTLATAYLGLAPPQPEQTVPDDTRWHPVAHLPMCAFDHASIINSALGRLRAKLSYTNIGFALAPDTFTLRELAHCYSAALGHRVSATNLQRVLLRRGALIATGDSAPATSKGGRPAAVYRFAEQKLWVTNEFAAFRPGATATSEARNTD
jgi:ADP-ribose pyrophosphatase YjhB (NUDIX family)